MRKLVKEYNVCKFEELSDDVKENVIDRLREKIVEDNFSFLKEDLNCIIKENYDIKECEIKYSLTCSQGDGLSFSCDDLLKSSYIMNRVKDSLDKTQKAMLTKLLNNDIIKFYSTGNQGHYCYSSEYDIDVEYNDYYWNITDYQDKLIEDVKDIISEIYLEICEDLEKIGYSYYDVDDDDVIDYINSYDYEFYESGEIYKE